MTVISSGVAFSAVKSIDVDHHVYGLGKGSEDSEDMEKPLGTPMMMQVAVVTTVVRPMSSSEFQAAMEFINNSKDSIKNLFNKGKAFYDKNEETFKKIKGAFTAMQGVGNIVSGVKKWMPEEEDPMVKNLAGLTNDVKALSDKLNNNFAEMKNFISQQSFFTDIMSPTAVLTMHMRDCLANPGEDSKENFLDAYEIMTPMNMQYKLSAYLEQRTSNPLRMSMESENPKMKATFEKWEDIYCRVMAQFMLLEAFASGLMGKKNERNCDRLIEASSDVLESIEKWRQEYGSDNGYWEEMKKNLGNYLKESTKKDNQQKARELKKMLESYLTVDAFYIMVFNEAKWEQEYTYVCNNEKEQLIEVWKTGGCNCIIYRSRKADKVTEEEHTAITRKVVDCKKKLHWTGDLKTTIKDQVTGPQLLPDNGFIALIKYSLDVRFERIFNTSIPGGWFSGPGCHDWVSLDNSYHNDYHLLYSYP